MQGKRLLWVWFVIAGLTVGLGVLDLGPTPSHHLANAPDDNSPTPEELLLDAGFEPDLRVWQGLLANPEQPNELRYWAALALGRSGNPAMLPSLAATLGAIEPDLRIGAVVGLGELGRGSHTLTPLLDDPEPGVRAATVHALAKIGDFRAVHLLIDKLRDPAEAEVEIRLEAARALAHVGSRPARLALREALDDGSAAVRAGAALGLARSGGREAIPTLVATALDPLTEEWLRVDAIEALETLSGVSFQYTKPYAAPTTAQERAAALASIEAWWASRGASVQ